MDNLSVLPIEYEDRLQAFIEEKFDQGNLRTAFPNPILREDVLDLLDRYCTVLYYPQVNEKNNGFHITDVPLFGGDKQNFVFINTAQTTEKQVFTAAHELGHIWKADDYIIQMLHAEDTPAMRERIINRFAAVLLMPCKSFTDSYMSELNAIEHDGAMVPLSSALRLVVALMYRFFVPHVAVVLRLLELGYVPEDTARLLLGQGDFAEAEILSALYKIIVDNGYTKFQTPSEKKWIEGLPELLREAEEKKCVVPDKIRKMRELFDLEAPPAPDQLDERFPLTMKERQDKSCN